MAESELGKWEKAYKDANTNVMDWDKAKGKGIVDENNEVETLEGKSKGNANTHYLAKGAKNEYYPIPKKKIEDDYTFIENDGDWKVYKSGKKLVEVAEIKVNVYVVTNSSGSDLTGNNGDYVVREIDNPDNQWIIAKDVFDETYKMED